MFKKIVIIGISLITIGLGLAFFQSYSKKQVPKSNPRKVTFHCADNRSIQAAFYSSYVKLHLSDGRSLSLPQVISASGARYADQKRNIVFWNKGNTAFITENDSMTYRGCVIKGEIDLTNLKTFRSDSDHLVFRYPRVFQIKHQFVNDTSGWSYESSQKGHLIIQLTTRASYQPKTNLAEATFTVGWSDHPKALHGCLDSTNSPFFHSDTITHNNTAYLRTEYTEAGAGNFYHILRYRTLRNNRCYSIEQMVHFMNINNYPAERGISEFDSTQVWKALHTPMNTLAFTNN